MLNNLDNLLSARLRLSSIMSFQVFSRINDNMIFFAACGHSANSYSIIAEHTTQENEKNREKKTINVKNTLKR